MAAGGRKKIRSLAQEEDYVSLSLPSIERRSLMESGMRRRTTRLDVIVVVVFFIALVALLTVLFGPAVVKLVRQLPDLVNGVGG